MPVTLVNSFVTWIMKKRFNQIEFFMNNPEIVQKGVLNYLLNTAKDTEMGRRYEFASINTIEAFQNRVPIQTYEDMASDIERIRLGEQNILWPSKIKWFAKSSGTSNDKSKYIPISQECLDDSHFKAGKDMLSIFCNNNPETRVFTGKSLRLGGSYAKYGENDTFFGDLSAIIIENMPLWADYMSTPGNAISLELDWKTKLHNIINESKKENVTSLAGVPSWMLALLTEMLELEQKGSILDVWPNLELFLHGGINFAPYAEQYKAIIPSSSFKYYEIYNASEGFFAFQDSNASKDMLLMLDYGIYYEFIPIHELDYANLHQAKTLTLDQVELDRDYALVITTNTGLWRYLIGDTVRFKSKSPYRIRVSGRTKNYINTFGEELMIHNAEEAITKACTVTDAVLEEFTVAPVYMSKDKAGYHQWFIEFKKEPTNQTLFQETLDAVLQEVNTDYQAKRYNNMTMLKPEIIVVPQGTFYSWLDRKGKLGGQHKVPRLKNDRTIADSILELLSISDGAEY